MQSGARSEAREALTGLCEPRSDSRSTPLVPAPRPGDRIRSRHGRTTSAEAIIGDLWTTGQIPDLSGRTAVVTGANSGVGFEAARGLAGKGARVVFACRDETRASQARRRLEDEFPTAEVEVMTLDLADLASVRRFGARFLAKHDRLDLLLNNAGLILVAYGVTADGYERQFAVNHLGHFALTGLLIEPLTATPGSRVVTVASTVHRRGEIDFDDLLFADGQGYTRRRAYARSKLANLLFTRELQRRLERAGTPTIATAAHPGHTRTGLGRHLEDSLAYRVSFACLRPILQSPAMGALPLLRAATDPDASGGDYFGPRGFREWGGRPVRVGSSDASRDPDAARRLWRLSEELTGVEYL